MTDNNSPNPTGNHTIADPSQEEIDLSQSVILVVDDNQQNVELMQAYLDDMPCQVLTAFDGLEAIELIEDPDRPTPDLILLDVMMPKMSGFDVCKRLKNDPQTRTIPIMMVTALNELLLIHSFPSIFCGRSSTILAPLYCLPSAAVAS